MSRAVREGLSTEDAEASIRNSFAVIGTEAMRTVIQAGVDRLDGSVQTPQGMVRQGRRPVWVRSMWGDFEIRRAY